MPAQKGNVVSNHHFAAYLGMCLRGFTPFDPPEDHYPLLNANKSSCVAYKKELA
jgi:hypothetical protein